MIILINKLEYDLLSMGDKEFLKRNYTRGGRLMPSVIGFSYEHYDKQTFEQDIDVTIGDESWKFSFDSFNVHFDIEHNGKTNIIYNIFYI